MGTRQFCRDNVTMFSDSKVGCYCNINTFVVATPSKHRDLKIKKNLVPDAILRCRVVVAAKLKSCWVPSYEYLYQY